MQPELLSTPSAFTNAFADYDNDGALDLFVGFDGKPNRLYRNDKGVLTDVAAAAGVADARPTRSVAWGDFDADGDPDLLVGFTPAPNASVLKVYRNDAGTFADVTAAAGLMVATGAVRDSANGPYFLAAIRGDFGLQPRLLTGEEEALLTFRGVASGRRIEEETLVVDVGGGSTELVVGGRGGVSFHASLDLGCVRETERFLGGQMTFSR